MEVLDAVPAVIWHIRKQMRDQRKGLSIPQFRALYMIRSQPAASLSEVAEHLGASLPTASRLIGGLEGKGLVKRRGCRADRRQMELVISQQGARVLDRARAATLAKMREEMSDLDAAQRQLITRAMLLLRGVFDPLWSASGASDKKVTANARPTAKASTPTL